MRVFELPRYNIPEKIIDSRLSQLEDHLLPVQERAIKRYGILEGNSVLTSSSTTSGKTFAGEIAAVKGVMEKKKMVCLVPLKSLAEEKYQEFKKKYQEFRIKVVVRLRSITGSLSANSNTYPKFSSAKTPLSGTNTSLLVWFFWFPSRLSSVTPHLESERRPFDKASDLVVASQ